MDDDDTTEIKGKNKAVNSFSEVGTEDKYVLRSKFAKFEEES